jgi:hypothetical protein
MNYSFLVRRSTGKIWQAGHDVWGLCSAWNHATAPGLLMTEREHYRAGIYAKAIKARMARLGLSYGIDWIELSNGTIWPIRRNRRASA